MLAEKYTQSVPKSVKRNELEVFRVKECEEISQVFLSFHFILLLRATYNCVLESGTKRLSLFIDIFPPKRLHISGSVQFTRTKWSEKDPYVMDGGGGISTFGRQRRRRAGI